jgi:hypothetical protein
MRTAAIAVAALFALTACESRPGGDESGRAADAADTVVTSEQNVDTTIVTQDTNVEVDTVQKEGDKPVDEDTLKTTGGDTATQ